MFAFIRCLIVCYGCVRAGYIAGGLTGLFLGASVVSVLEVLELIVRLASHLCSRKQVKVCSEVNIGLSKVNRVNQKQVKGGRVGVRHEPSGNLFLV